MRLAVLALAVSSACGGLDPCDIREASCQDAVFYAVLDARGDTWDAWASPPDIQVISAGAYRAVLEEAYQSSEETYDLWDAAFTLVGMVDPDVDLVAASIDSRVANTVAFYSPATRDVTIIDHGEPTELSRDTETLAHELVHALQDRYRGLEAIEGEAITADEWFAARSMVEGEAVLFARMVIAGASDLGYADLDWDRLFTIWRDALDEDIAAAPSRFTEALRRYVYPIGGRHMAAAYDAGGTPEVQRWLYRPPRTAAQALDGPGGPERPPPGIACRAVAPDGYALEGEDVLGAIGAFALLNDNVDGARASWEQARQWQADRMRIFEAAPGEIALVWRLRWTSASRARSLVEELHGRVPRWRLYEQANEVVIVAASDPGLFERWDPLACE